MKNSNWKIPSARINLTLDQIYDALEDLSSGDSLSVIIEYLLQHDAEREAVLERLEETK